MHKVMQFFDFEKWTAAFEKAGIDMAFYTQRKRDFDEILPWDVIDCSISKAFFKRECEKAYGEATTPHCREKCSGCGANKLGGERSCCPKIK